MSVTAPPFFVEKFPLTFWENLVWGGVTPLTDGFRDWGFCGVSVSVGSTSRISDEKQRGEIMRAGEKPRGEHQHGGGVEGALVQQWGDRQWLWRGESECGHSTAVSHSCDVLFKIVVTLCMLEPEPKIPMMAGGRTWRPGVCGDRWASQWRWAGWEKWQFKAFEKGEEATQHFGRKAKLSPGWRASAMWLIAGESVFKTIQYKSSNNYDVVFVVMDRDMDKSILGVGNYFFSLNMHNTIWEDAVVSWKYRQRSISRINRGWAAIEWSLSQESPKLTKALWWCKTSKEHCRIYWS